MIDSSIPLSGKMPTFETPFQVAGQAMNLLQMAGQGQLQDLQLKQAQQSASEQDQLKALFQDQTLTPDTLIPRVMAINPQIGMTLQKSLVEGQKSDLDLRIRRSERLGQIAASVKPGDDTSFHNAIAQAFGEQLIPGPVAQQMLSLPPGPARDAQVQQFASQSMSAKDQLENQRKAMGFPADQAKKQADADEAALKMQNSRLLFATNQLSAALKFGGPTKYGRLLDTLPEAIASRFPAASFPGLNEEAIRSAALTPEQAETSQTSRDRLDISRGQLAVAQQREAREARGSRQGGLSEAQRGVVERNKAAQLASLERQFKADTKILYQNPKTGARSPEDQAAYDAAGAKLTEQKLQVENSYRAQLGLEPLDSGWGTPAGAPARTAAPTTGTATKAGTFVDPKMRTAAKAALQNAGYAYDDSSIDMFLAKPVNRARLGYK